MFESAEAQSQQCQAACQVFSDAQASLTKWDRLVLILGWATTIFSIVLLIAVVFIVFVPDMATGVGAAIGAGGTLVSGAAFLFVVNQRNGARDHQRDALKDVNDFCTPVQVGEAIEVI